MVQTFSIADKKLVQQWQFTSAEHLQFMDTPEKIRPNGVDK